MSISFTRCSSPIRPRIRGKLNELRRPFEMLLRGASRRTSMCSQLLRVLSAALVATSSWAKSLAIARRWHRPVLAHLRNGGTEQGIGDLQARSMSRWGAAVRTLLAAPEPRAELPLLWKSAVAAHIARNGLTALSKHMWLVTFALTQHAGVASL
mmetsp:Transcript_94730/g.203469  ORF Transcript_94730/g.203469 Transcript_94730/m.203469 type:complete len:154 (+) Transcript_94730:1583-2044(+)